MTFVRDFQGQRTSILVGLLPKGPGTSRSSGSGAVARLTGGKRGNSAQTGDGAASPSHAPGTGDGAASPSHAPVLGRGDGAASPSHAPHTKGNGQAPPAHVPPKPLSDTGDQKSKVFTNANVSNGPSSTSHVLGGQINLQKGQAGASNLMKYLQTRLQSKSNNNKYSLLVNSFIISLQEPPTKDGKILGLDKRNHIFSDRSTNRPRAAIYASKDLNLWLSTEYTSADIATCIWLTDEEEIYVCSVYMDITQDNVWPIQLEKLVTHCKRRNKKLLISADTNAHSALWGCDDTNKRGEKMEEFIFQHNLAVNNKGNHFTFYNRRSQTIIDVTMSSQDLEDHIKEWEVKDNVQGSDHLLIEFIITISIKLNYKSRNLRSGDWNLFQETLEEEILEIPECWTTQRLDKEAESFARGCWTALNRSHPERMIQNNPKKPVWWKDKLSKLNKKVKTAFSRFRKTRSSEKYDDLKKARRTYSKAIRTAKREGWKNFCNEADNPAKVAAINRIIKAKTQQQIGILRREDGTMCQGPEESLKRLTDVHFPGSMPIRKDEEIKVSCDINNDAAYFINETTVRQAIITFGDFKAPGPDGIPPKVLKQIGPRALKMLTRMYKASYLLGYVPLVWRQARVIFIPKEGRKDYAEPRSFRPITLSNFIVKAMERVVLWEFNNTTLTQNPLNVNQHAFRKGKSTESALSTMVDHIEKALQKDEIALGVFLDIQGAFDNVMPESIIQGMLDKGATNELTNWYSHYLRNRRMTIDYKGTKVERQIIKGTPQGGVLSPVMWNLAFESLLQIFDEGWVKAVGFADDAGLIISGKNPLVLMSRMQKAIDRALEWGDRSGLTFSPPKTVAVLFTRKRKMQTPPLLKMGGVEIPYSDTVKYLGITLDKKLTWKAHITNKVRNAKIHLHSVKNAMGKLWGTPPKWMRWAYTGIVRPAITYGALVWAKGCETEHFRKELQRINRLALLSMGHFRRSTPTAGLEVIGHVMPLDLYIKSEAALGCIRTRQQNIKITENSGIKRGHRQIAEEFLKLCDIVCDQDDFLITEHNWTKNFTIDVDSMKEGTPSRDCSIEIYTDGSRHNNLTGSGFYVQENLRPGSRTKEAVAFHLGASFSVFQGEMHGIMKAAEWIAGNCTFQKINIHVDSKAAIQALAKYTVNSNQVKSAILALNLAADCNNFIHIRWVKAHVGHPGNEKADTLAKRGAEMVDLETEKPLRPHSCTKRLIREGFERHWNSVWTMRSDCRQTKHWFPTIDKNKSLGLLGNNRENYSRLVQFITGHNYMRRHEALVNHNDENECRLCWEDEESSFHIIAECPAIARARHQVFGAPFLRPPLIWSIRQITSFLRMASIGSLLDQTLLESQR